jgi:hypothetical protein
MANSLISAVVKTSLKAGKFKIPVATVLLNSNRIKTIDTEGANDSKVYYQLRKFSGNKDFLDMFTVDDAPAVLQPKISKVSNKSVSLVDTAYGAARYFPVDDIIYAKANVDNPTTHTDIWLEVGSAVIVRKVTHTMAQVITATVD